MTSKLCLCLLGVCAAAQALPVAAQARGPAVAGAASAPASTDALAQRHVIEDDQVRIEETRLRGAAQRITVHSKLAGVRPYEIQVAPPGRDASQLRGSAGQRTWSLFDF